MAVDNRFVYGVEVDIAQARRAVAVVKRMFDDATKGAGVDKANISQITRQQTQITAATRSQSAIRATLARTEGQVAVIEARKSATASAEIQRRKTATHKAELQKRERAERQSGQRVTNSQRVKSQVSSVANLAIGGLVAGGAAYAVANIGRQTVEIAKLRTEINRSNVAFLTLSGTEKEAAANLAAVGRASGGTVDRLEAQQLATTALTLGLADNAKGIERVVNASKLIATVSPQINDTATAVSQLGLAAANQSFVRLDQLGLSAGEVRVEIKRLKAANSELTDSEAFLEAALIRVEAKFGDIGTSAATTAQGTEQLAVAWTNLRLTIAESGVGDAANTAITSLAYGIGLFSGQLDPLQENIAAVSNAIAGLDKAANSDGIFFGNKSKIPERIAEFEQIKKALENVQDALTAGIPNAEHYADKISRIAAESTATGRVTDAQLVALRELSQWFATASDQAEIFALKQYNLAGATAAANAELSAQPKSDPFAKFRPGAVQTQQNYGTGQSGSAGVNYDIGSEVRALAVHSSERLYDEEKERIAATEKEWAKAAKSTASSWESEIKSALQSVPGLFDASEVTEDDMEAAAAGTYQEKADEYLRQLRDEMTNGKDYADVDIQDAAARAGIDPSLPVEEIFRQFEQAWNDSSLFADGLNLDLINQDAVQAAVDKAKKSGNGEAALLSYFSAMYGPEVAEAMITGGSAGPGAGPTVPGAAKDGQLEGSMLVNKVILSAGATFQIEQFPDFAGALIPAMYDSIFSNEDAVADLHLIGGALVGAVHQGWRNKVPEYNWVNDISGTAQAQAAQQVLDAINAAIATGANGGT